MGTREARETSVASSAIGSESGKPTGTSRVASAPRGASSADDLGHLAEEDRLRAQFYGLLARLLAEPASEPTLATLRQLSGGDSELGQAIETLAEVASRTPRERAAEEFSALFYGSGAGGEVLPYASHYLAGFLYEKPLANLRADLARLGVAAREEMTEPEDHIAFVCEVMHGLIVGTYGRPADLAVQRDFFRAHLEPWAARCFADIEQATAAALYMPIGTVGRLFIEIESEAFALASD